MDRGETSLGRFLGEVHRLHPCAGAVAVGVSYALLAGLYIATSTVAARWLSTSLNDLAWLEAVKGFVFVGSTALGLMALWYGFAARVGRVEERIRERDRALLETQRQAELGLFAGSVAHDVNNVLSVLRSGIDELSEVLAGHTAERPLLDDMDAALDRAAVLTRRLGVGRGAESESQHEHLDLGALCRDVVRGLRHHPSLRGTEVTVRAAEGVVARCDGDALGHAVANLVINAGEALAGGGRVEVVVEARDSERVIEVHDDGPGVPAERVPEMFEPFTTSKAHGTGLGLFSVRGCLDRHGGGVAYTQSPLGGACFRAWLPRDAASAATLARS